MDTQFGISLVRMQFQSFNVCDPRGNWRSRSLALCRAVHRPRSAPADGDSARVSQSWTRSVARLSNCGVRSGCDIGSGRNVVTRACRVNANSSNLAECQFHLLTVASDEHGVVANLFARNHYIVILDFYLGAFACHHACIVDQDHAAGLRSRNRL
jgi:hypothetical protein